MSTVSKLMASVSCDSNEFARGLDQAASKFLNFRQFMDAQGAATAAAIAAPIVGAVATVLKAGYDMQGAFGELQATTGKTGDALERLKTGFQSVFLHSTQNADEVSRAYGLLSVRTHAQGRELTALGEKEAAFARITRQDMVETVDETTAVFNKWGVKSAEMGVHLDQLLAASQRTGTAMNKLQDDMLRVAGPLQDMGLSFEQSANLLGTWEANGVVVQHVMFGLRQGIVHLAQAHVPLKEGMIDAIKQIQAQHDETKKLDMATRMFGKRAGEEIVLSLKRGSMSVQDFTKAFHDSTDAVKKADDAVNPLGKNLAELGHSFTLAIQPSKEFMDTINGDVSALKDFCDWIGKTNQAIDEQRAKQHKGGLWDEMFGSVPVQKEEEQLMDGSNYTDKMKKGLAQTQEHLMAADVIFHDFVPVGEEIPKAVAAGIAKGEKRVSDAVAELMRAKPKHHKMSEHDKEFAEFKKEKEGALKELQELEDGGSLTAAHLMHHFHALENGTVISLANIRVSIDQLINKQREMHKATNMIDEAKAHIVELKNELDFGRGGMFSVEALRSALHGLVPDNVLKGLSQLLNLQQNLTVAVEKKRQADEHDQQLTKEGARRVADLKAEYLRLTHTRYEDQISLELYGKTFAEVTDKVHQKTVESAAFWLRTNEAEKELIKTNKEMESSENSLKKAIEEMNLKLQMKSAIEEEEKATKELLTAYDKLPPALKNIERELEAKARFGESASFAALTGAQQKEIDQVLDLTHALAIKSKAEKDDDARTKESAKITEELSLHLNEQIEHEQELLGIHKQKVSAFTQRMEMLRAENKLTVDQIKLLDQIEAHEKNLPDIEKHAKLIKQLSDTMRGEFTKLFEDLALGHKGVFKSIEEDFSKMLAKMAADYLASRLSQLFTQFIGGLLGGGGVSKTSSSSIQSYAIGGNMAPGELAMVGENGPEFFRANQAGTIIPNGHGGGGGGIMVNAPMTVYAQDANSFRYSQQQIAQQMGNLIQRSLQRNG